ncbi:hypothetical protein [Duganella radicis]|uniref:hypothetical protein n=1 Tax=Duganella radicis TaxID=551988 RepID=UPI001E4F9895|nr:hypothetical protein [Duganella radicis]
MTLSYDPNRLLDELQCRLNAKNDAALARALEVQPPLLSKIRHRRMPVGSGLLLRAHEATGLSIRTLQDLLGDRRRKYRISETDGKPDKMAGRTAIRTGAELRDGMLR